MMNRIHIVSAIILLAAALLTQGCQKRSYPSSSAAHVCFAIPTVADDTKAPLHTSMGPTYNTGESFVVFAAYSESEFDPSGSFENYWDANGITCSYNSTYNAWAPAADYYWPLTGYLSFWAYSPADGFQPSLDWSSGFTYTNFTVPVAGAQYDLLYSGLVENCQYRDYTITDGNAHDDDPDFEYIYNGVNMKFKHALSLIEVQASSALGSYSAIKYYIQSVELHNAFYKGTFTSSNEIWTVNTGLKTDYTLLDLSGEADPDDQWKVLPGSDQYPVSVHPEVTLMLLPQELDRPSDPDFSTSVDAYLTVVYKCSTDDVSHTTSVPISGIWERGKKYTYKLVFSADIEFTASISSWDTDITYGSWLIVQ